LHLVNQASALQGSVVELGRAVSGQAISPDAPIAGLRGE
jgi:hypothetical protein